jgi:DNA polymerase-3 subunit delta'
MQSGQMLPWFTDTYNELLVRYFNNKLHHALLFIGAKGIGKAKLVAGLSDTLLCKKPTPQGACNACQSCHLRLAGNHPDFYVLESEKQLGVDKIREGIAKLSGTAQMGGNKVLVIPVADSMTEAAANALLKTLEEPTNNTYLLLITDSLNRIMPTILSRCEKHSLGLPDVQSSLAYLQQQGVQDASEALLEAYGYAPLRLEAALNSESDFNYRTFTDGMGALLASSGSQQLLALANKWQGDAVQVATWCQHMAHKSYVERQQTQDYARYRACVDAVKTLQHPGVNKSMVLVSILKQFQR